MSNMFGARGRAPGGLIDNRAPMKSPPVVPPAPTPHGLMAADLDAIIGSWSTYHVGASAPSLTLETMGRDITTLEVGPGSLWDAMEVQPVNGPAIVLSPGVRYPAGVWRGPIAVRPNVGRPRFPILGTAAFGTWVVNANTYSPQIAVGVPLFIPPKVELVAYPARDLAAVQPLSRTRAPLAFQASVFGSDVPASTFIAALVAHYGRTRANVTLSTAGAETFAGVVWGYRGSSAPTVVWPILPATTFTVSVAAALTIEIDGEWDYLAVAGSWNAGAGETLIVNYSSQD